VWSKNLSVKVEEVERLINEGLSKEVSYEGDKVGRD